MSVIDAVVESARTGNRQALRSTKLIEDEKIMIRFGILGAGFMGSVHAGNIAANPRARLISIYDIDQGKSRSLAATHGARAAASAEALLGAQDIDAVLISSSTPTHADYLRGAAEKGKAVLCEKPISLDFDTAKGVCEIVNPSGIPAVVGFNRRFDANYAALQREVGNGVIGKVEIVHMTHRGPLPPSLEYLKSSGGQFRDSGVHFFDLLRWISGDDPVEVFVFGACLVNPQIAALGDSDTSVISLRLPRGGLCQINFSRRTAYGYDEHVEVFGSEGMIESQRKRTGDIALYKGDRIVSDGLYPGWFERIEETYRLEVNAFIDSLEGGAATGPTLDDGLKAQAIAEAATESFKSSRPVSISY